MARSLFRSAYPTLLNVMVGVLPVLTVIASCGAPAPARFVTSVLPGPTSDGICSLEAPLPRTTMCDWYHMGDAFFVGTVLAVDPVYTPVATIHNVLLSSCSPEETSPGITLDIRPVQWLSGAPVDPRADFRIHIGASQIKSWGTFQVGADGTASFRSHEKGSALLFPVGSVIGGTLNLVLAPGSDPKDLNGEGRLWSTADHFFTADENGLLLNPQDVPGECGGGQPEFVGWTFDELSKALDECGSTEPTPTAKTFYDNRTKTPDPTTFYSATCQQNSNVPSSRHCDEGHHCQIGYCENERCECYGAEICESYWKGLGL